MTVVVVDRGPGSRALGQRYHLPMADQLDKRAADSAALWLDMAPGGLVLGGDVARFGHPLRVDFAEGKNAHRRQFGGGRGQLIARACGLKQGRTPSIVDATAGLGRDAFVLASLGCTVLMVERVAAIAAVLDDGLQRAQAHPDVAYIASRLSLRWADSVSALARVVDEAGVPPQVVHLDPMFPHREKSALVKKDMRLFQALAGADEDAALLLRAALDVATHRVVVKRPRKAPSIDGPAPSHQVIGKTSRYDIYVHQALS